MKIPREAVPDHAGSPALCSDPQAQTCIMCQFLLPPASVDSDISNKVSPQQQQGCYVSVAFPYGSVCVCACARARARMS